MRFTRESLIINGIREIIKCLVASGRKGRGEEASRAVSKAMRKAAGQEVRSLFLSFFLVGRTKALYCSTDCGNGMRMASAGHSAAQKPHSSQNSSSTRANRSLSSMARGGQTSMHFLHPVHFSPSMSGITSLYPSDRLHVWRCAGASASWRPLPGIPSEPIR